MSTTVGPVAESVRQKLSVVFAPSHLQVGSPRRTALPGTDVSSRRLRAFSVLQVINESLGHNVPKGSETHFKVVVISDLFDGHKILARHRMVNEALAAELSGCEEHIQTAHGPPARDRSRPANRSHLRPATRAPRPSSASSHLLGFVTRDTQQRPTDQLPPKPPYQAPLTLSPPNFFAPRPVHALSIVAKTPAQWEASEGAVAPSPNCMGGAKR
jgi:stress-induced morphogen